jgi:hypothetical protein
VSCLPGLLDSVGRDIERQLKPQLSGLFGGILRGYLPQTWVFKTEEGNASLRVDTDGHAAAIGGVAPQPDVTIETTHARLAAALTTRSKVGVPPGPLKVTPHTEKGRLAFEFLRSRLGL